LRQTRFAHEFVEYIPEELVDGVLYVSMAFSVASHKCACGCGREVVTPLSPTDWRLLFDGAAVSLEPSIGNWNFPCRSHYFIRDGGVRWAGDMPQAAVEYGRAKSRQAKERFYASRLERPPMPAPASAPAPDQEQRPGRKETGPAPEAITAKQSWWVELLGRLRRR